MPHKTNTGAAFWSRCLLQCLHPPSLSSNRYSLPQTQSVSQLKRNKQTHCTDQMAIEFEAFTHKIRGSKVQQRTITSHHTTEKRLRFSSHKTKPKKNTRNAIIIIHSSSLTNVFMIHVTKQLDFTEGPLCINLVIKRIRNLLDGNVLIRLRVQSRAVHTKTTQKTTQNFSIFHSQKKKKK